MKPQFLKTQAEKQYACLALIRQFEDIGEVEPCIKIALATMRSKQKKDDVVAGKAKPESPDIPETKVDHPKAKPEPAKTIPKPTPPLPPEPPPPPHSY